MQGGYANLLHKWHRLACCHLFLAMSFFSGPSVQARAMRYSAEKLPAETKGLSYNEIMPQISGATPFPAHKTIA